MDTDDDLTGFWSVCRERFPDLAENPPEAWAFGATAAQADELLRLVLAGTKTGTASSLWDYEVDGDPLPSVGDLSIVLNGSGAPRALIETTDVRIVPFGDVTAEHAHAEGEGDRTLDGWRVIHERFWREHATDPRGFQHDMPVVCERFQLRYPPVLTPGVEDV